MANVSTQCSLGQPSVEILPNSTHSPVCGVKLGTSNKTLVSSCCGSSPVSSHNCLHYCSSNDTIADWWSCIRNQSDSTSPFDVFCQAAISGNNTDTIQAQPASSAALPRPTPSRLHWTLVCFAIFALFSTTATARTVPSLQRRSAPTNGSCTIEIARNYTTLRSKSSTLTTQQGCSQDYCTIGAVSPIDTDILENNRTINNISAADAKYDVFFDTLHNMTGRWFPALSSSELLYSFVIPSGLFSVAFTPYAWCVNGTVSGCGGDFGSSNQVEACGPVFVTEPNDATLPDAPIQGVLSLVNHGS